MGTFVEFYCTLLGFINYRLYTSIGLVYPPKFDTASDEKGAELAAFTLEGRGLGEKALEDEESQKAITNGHSDTQNSAKIQAQLDQIAQDKSQDEIGQQQQAREEDAADDEGIDKFQVAAPEADDLPQPDYSSNIAASLFSDFTFFISREAPRHPIEFILRAFGCKRIGWDSVLGEGAFTHDEKDPRITHQIVDRPAVLNSVLPTNGQTIETDEKQVQRGNIVVGRIYVQPQWIWDCMNEGKLLRTDLYAPGATLPPHLSPWMKPTKGQYDPRATLEEQQLEGEAEDDVSEEENELENGAALSESEGEEELEEDGGEMAVDVEETDSEASEVDNFGGFEDGEADAGESSEDEESRHQAELAAEAAGVAPDAKSKARSQKEQKKSLRNTQKRKEDEEIERQKMMMSNKKRKLYEKMQYSNEKKDAEAEKLRKKRRKLEKGTKA